jgi:glutamate--cysteine ligase
MAAPQAQADPISGLPDLIEPFHRAEKPRAEWRVGAEAEKFGVFSADGSPFPYEGPRQSVSLILARLVERHGWAEDRELPGGPVIALRRDNSSITLEPGAQLEMSGAPQPTIHAICAELRDHMAELHDVSADMGVTWLGLGFHPFARQEDLSWVPKLRYRIMRRYLPTRGPRALDMMLRTATVQANVDYDSEVDAMRKLRVALRLSPIVAAMFANSPWLEGQPSGGRSERTRVWLGMDPDRSGLLPWAWDDGEATYRRYVDYALDVPMFLIRRGDDILDATDRTFRQFLAEGLSGHRATRADWELHLNTLFPEVRLKRTLELRSADAQATDLVCALPAVWKGILYCPQALAAAESLGERWGHDEAVRALHDIAGESLRARLAGREVAEWARELLAIADGGLERHRCLNEDGQDERIHLARLRELVEAGRCPADALLEGMAPEAPFVEQVLARAAV